MGSAAARIQPSSASSGSTWRQADPSDGCNTRAEVHCRYIAEWVGTKLRRPLSADEAEAAAMRDVAADCSEQTVTYEPAL
ncbi:hypothetical protein OIE75_40030 [Streptomyces sp. NBC_01723]|uniref:hypothetical protein n=1 Tax=Streptomyces sp. NBC_01723 TaxID=2975921 RepID=UPI002E333B55|nr:hypothetical protein [Streptomyces sp. NBC_01723]